MNKVKQKLTTLVEQSLLIEQGQADRDSVATSIDKACESFNDFVAELKKNACKYQDILNDLSSDYENYVNDDYQQGLLSGLDEIIDWLYNLQKD